ncbi:MULTISPECIES: hypothetical protein [Fischerella]|uniref:Uncharacterized protein n=1 Tax=Fischerella muscicola CCMEE 5323 TaxID=2019572 RepID=A0A2N6K6B9_FISMU|nr:hypothetical protein [Fischerella muscicola]MBD2430416.1 hypothetical protein [Fischerella sp. FACHB-380]PLZ92397.1 hypothetical protein CEN44_06060 [Fischerella muscicola CCMEE 5323]
MKKQIALILSIFTSAVFATIPVQAVPSVDIPKQPTSPNLEKKAPTQTTTLTLQDLPSGYKEVPPQLKEAIAVQLEPFKQLIAKENLPLNNFFAFIEPQKMEVVMGFTGMLANQTQQTQFDAALQQVQQPEFEKEIKKLQQVLPSDQQVQLLGYKALPEANKLANTSTGFSLGAKIQELPVNFDVIGFRRSNFGSFTAVMYLTEKQPSISVKDVATKLDERFLQSSSTRNSPRVTK